MRTLRPIPWAIVIFAVCQAVLSATRQDNRATQFLDAYEHGVLLQVSPDQLPTLMSGLDRAASTWVNADTAKSERRRQLAALAPLELAASLPVPSRPAILEWACEFLRKGKPDEFERTWMLTAFALLEEVQEFVLDNRPAAHAKHARSRFPTDPALRLAEILTRPEAITFSNTPGISDVRLRGAIGFGETSVGAANGRRMDLNQTTQWLRDLGSDPVVGAEATIRLGTIEFLRGQTGPALAHLQTAAQQTQDPYLKNFNWLLQGLIAEARGDDKLAATAYRSAYTAQPTVSAAIALAASLFLSGERDAADLVLASSLRAPVPPVDPWHHPVGAERNAIRDIERLRSMAGLLPRLQQPAAGLPTAGPAPSVNTAEQGRPAVQITDSASSQSTAMPNFRASATSVMVDVTVLNGKVPVKGLTAADFEILDNGVSQTIDAQGAGQVPLDVSIVLEMNEPEGPGSLEKDPWYPVQALKDVAAVAGLLRPSDRIRLVVASQMGPVETLTMQSAASAAQQGARISLTAISNRRTSSLFDGTAAALIAKVPADRRSLVLVFTDGIDGTSVLTPKRVTALARESDSVVYLARRYTDWEQWMHLHPKSAIPDTDERSMVRPIPPTAVEELARVTGGLVRHPERGESLVTFFNQVLEDFRGRYIFHYTPSGVSEKGWHTITVRLKSGRHTVIARRGYFAG